MASFHRHCYWLLFFVFFLCLIISHKCDHSLGLLITSEVLCWDIILPQYIIIVFLQAQCRHFTVNVVDCCILKFSVTPPHRWLQPLIGIADYIVITLTSNHIINIYHHCFSLGTMASFNRHRCWFLYFEVFLWFLLTDECYHLFGLLSTLEVLFWAIVLSPYIIIVAIILSQYIIIVFSDNNGFVSLSMFLIVIFWNFSVTPPHRRVQPIIGIASYIGNALLSNHIIAIYHHCFNPNTMELFHRQRFWLLYFEF